MLPTKMVKLELHFSRIKKNKIVNGSGNSDCTRKIVFYHQNNRGKNTKHWVIEDGGDASCLPPHPSEFSNKRE